LRRNRTHSRWHIYTVGNAIKLISRATTSAYELNKLSLLLSNAQKENVSAKQVERKITQDLPELSSLASVLPQTRMELYTVIGLILTAIYFMLTEFPNKKSLSEEDIEAIAEKTIQRSISKPNIKGQLNKSSPNSKEKKKKIGRNELCACDSGIKYKKCCLQSI